MTLFLCILLSFLVVCAACASLSKSLLNTILIFMSYSLVMSVIWILLEAPDLAITEAAVGAGVTTVLFLVTLKKINAILREEEEETDAGAEPEGEPGQGEKEERDEKGVGKI